MMALDVRCIETNLSNSLHEEDVAATNARLCLRADNDARIPSVRIVHEPLAIATLPVLTDEDRAAIWFTSQELKRFEKEGMKLVSVFRKAQRQRSDSNLLAAAAEAAAVEDNKDNKDSTPESAIDEETDSLRGLEEFLSIRAGLEAKKRKVAVRQAVFDEQRRYRKSAIKEEFANPQDEAIRKASRAASKPGRDLAIGLAHQDARAVRPRSRRHLVRSTSKGSARRLKLTVEQAAAAQVPIAGPVAAKVSSRRLRLVDGPSTPGSSNSRRIVKLGGAAASRGQRLVSKSPVRRQRTPSQASLSSDDGESLDFSPMRTRRTKLTRSVSSPVTSPDGASKNSVNNAAALLRCSPSRLAGGGKSRSTRSPPRAAERQSLRHVAASAAAAAAATARRSKSPLILACRRARIVERIPSARSLGSEGSSNESTGRRALLTRQQGGCLVMFD